MAFPTNRYRKFGKKRMNTKRATYSRGGNKIRRRRAYLPRLKPMAIMGTGLPQKVMVKHKYVQSVNEAVGAGALQSYAFRANGMYQPTVSTLAGSHQPMYFDQYSALYNHYCVIGAKVTFKITHITAPTSNSAFRICAFLDDDPVLSATNIDAVAEATQGRSITIIPPNTTYQITKTLNFSAKKIFGGSVLGNKALTGTIIANPTEQSYFIFVVQNPPGQDSDICVTAEIEYVAIWTELKEVAQS